MTFDTFDSYNTDEAYKDKGTTAKGLVDAYKKDNPNGSADDFYSKLNKTWAQDKDGHVKNAVNEAFKAKEEVKEEPKAEEKTAPKVEEMTQTTEALKPEEEKKEEPKLNLSKADKDYMDSQSAIIDEAKRKAINDAVNEKASSYRNTLDTLEKQGEAFRNIDDKLIDQLPTFMWRRYQNGEFGDPKSSDAKLRLAYFAINNVVSKLKMVANADAIARGQGQIFGNTESAYDQYQASNLAQGLENRWNKYKTETNNAMNLLINRGLKEEELTDAARTIAQNQNLQNAFNMVDENKKAYILEVVTKLGDKIGNMNDKKFVNLILGMASSGSVDPSQAAEMIGIRAGGSLADKYNLFDDNGNIDLSVIKDLVGKLGKETVGNMLGEYGVDINKLDYDTASIIPGGNNSTGSDGVYDEKKTGNKFKNPTGNLKGYRGLDGNTYDFSTFATKEEKDNLAKISKDLSDRYYNGEIDAATYKKYLDPLVREASKHTGIKVFDTDTMIKKNIKLKLDNLNKAAKKGTVPVDSYKEQTAKILSMAEDAGYSEKDIAALKKDFKDTSKIKYKGPDKK